MKSKYILRIVLKEETVDKYIKSNKNKLGQKVIKEFNQFCLKRELPLNTELRYLIGVYDTEVERLKTLKELDLEEVEIRKGF